MSIKPIAPAMLLLSAALVIGPLTHAQSPAATISLEDRAWMATQIYHTISTFFPGLSKEKFDADYAEYLRTIVQSDERRNFDLASMEFVARLHDGHSWFYDNWLDHTTAQPNGFIAYPLAGQWTVVHSNLDSVKAALADGPGDGEEVRPAAGEKYAEAKG